MDDAIKGALVRYVIERASARGNDVAGVLREMTGDLEVPAKACVCTEQDVEAFARVADQIPELLALIEVRP